MHAQHRKLLSHYLVWPLSWKLPQILHKQLHRSDAIICNFRSDSNCPIHGVLAPKIKATPQHAETFHSSLFIQDVRDKHRKSVWTCKHSTSTINWALCSKQFCHTHCSGYSSYAIPNPTGFLWAVKISPWHGHNMFLNWPLHEDEWVSSLPCQ